MTLKAKEYKSDIKPIWCPGCGDYGVLTGLTKALSVMESSLEKTAIISGIGCSSRLPAYTKLYGFHAVHGRALPVATGLKVARPDIDVFAVGGDGDGFSIGGNHFLHACRRNVNLVYLVMDNEVYGMTKGQASPTTASDWSRSKLTPQGTQVRPFQPCAIALASGASFIARAYSGDPNGLAKIIVEAAQFEGFAFIQVLSQCITFRPEQKEWKHQVSDFEADLPTDDPVKAASLLHADNGLMTGVVYKSPSSVWGAKSIEVNKTQQQQYLESLIMEFEV